MDRGESCRRSHSACWSPVQDRRLRRRAECASAVQRFETGPCRSGLDQGFTRRPSGFRTCSGARGDRGDSLGSSAGSPAAAQPQQQDPLGAPPFVQLAHESTYLRAADERNATGWQAGSKERKGRPRPLDHQSAHRRLLAAHAPLGRSQRQPRSPIQTEALVRLRRRCYPREAQGSFLSTGPVDGRVVAP
jgi:hypothetical protein